MTTRADGWPRQVLVVGCGLIGTSIALAARRDGRRVDGVDVQPAHRAAALQMGAVDRAAATIDALAGSRYDLAVLAVPVDVACRILPDVARRAEVVMDVCSVKAPVCDAAERCGLQDRFSPTHPMAGLAAAGPADARASLFEGQSWLLVDRWPSCDRIRPFIEATGAVPVRVDSAQAHDAAMAAVSHAVHLTSLAAMLAYEDARWQQGAPADWAPMSGPGFRDVTRLCGSPAGFWVSTLLANRGPVAVQALRIADWLARFADVLERADAHRLEEMLTQAHEARRRWERERSPRR